MFEIDKLEFVGREEHLNRIISLIQEANTLHVV